MSIFNRMLITLSLSLFASVAAANFDLEGLRDQTLEQITIDSSAITDIPEGSSPEFQRDLRRNRHITAYYAEIYLSNPEQFQWAGLAAYVSNEVGNQLKEFQEAGLANIFGNEYQAVVDANIAVYADIYWQHQAYREYGLDALEQAFEDGMISDSMLQAWRFIDQQAVDDGVVLLAEYEQGVVLQEVLYDPLYPFFAGFLRTTVFESPIPDHEAPFEGENIAEFDQRWEWTTNALLPGWSNFQEEQPERIRTDFLAFMLNAENDALTLAAAEYACEGDADCAATTLQVCADDLTVACLQSSAASD